MVRRIAGAVCILAIIAIGLVFGFLWLAVQKSAEAAQAPHSHDPDNLIGMLGEARTLIQSNDGSAQVGGELWSARSDDLIPAGEKVIVIRRDGFVVVVEKVIHSG